MQGTTALAETLHLGLSSPWGTFPTLDVTLPIDTLANAAEMPLIVTSLRWGRSNWTAICGADLTAFRGPRSVTGARTAKLRSRGACQSVAMFRRVNETGVEHLSVGAG